MGCQLVCDARGLLLSAETHWPGGLKDTDVLEKSAVYKQLLDTEEGWLLGETGGFHTACDILLSLNMPKKSMNPFFFFSLVF